MLIELIAAVDQSREAVTTSAFYPVRSTGSAIGVSAASAVYESFLTAQLPSKLEDGNNATTIISRVGNNSGAIKGLRLTTRSVVVQLHMDALRWVLMMTSTVGALTRYPDC